ncbi:MAG TPA: DUF4412 domain-containing protein [Chthoniobacterales bacterium]|nr:DUF4412 domain-containing protein [Chthoniobacterales bacterium]
MKLPTFFLAPPGLILCALAKNVRAGYERSMKLLRLLCLAGFALTTVARADLTIVEKIEGSNDTSNVVLKVKGDKARVEVNPQITTILNGKTGDLITLMNDQKKVMRISGDRAQAMAKMASTATGDNIANVVPKPTGKKKTIEGYETEEYITDSPHLHTAYWVAKNYPNYQSILQQMQVLQRGAFAVMHKGVPDYSKLPGLPIRTEINGGDKTTVVSTLVSVKTDPVPDSAFEVPAGYTEMKMPDFLNGEKHPSAQPESSGKQ